MTDRTFVAEKNEIQPGERMIVDIEETSVGIFNIDGELYTLENKCAHQGGPVCTGKQQGAIEAEFVEPGERVEEKFSEDVPAIACPWHGFEYDVRTGEHVGDDSYNLRTFDVVVEDGEVYIDL